MFTDVPIGVAAYASLWSVPRATARDNRIEEFDVLEGDVNRHADVLDIDYHEALEQIAKTDMAGAQRRPPPGRQRINLAIWMFADRWGLSWVGVVGTLAGETGFDNLPLSRTADAPPE